MSTFEQVLANPGSLAARRALMAEWRTQNDPRAELIEKQLAYRELVEQDGPGSLRAERLDAAIRDLIWDHGRNWAGKVAGLVDKYRFMRGLVAQVTLPGEKFLAVADELFGLAPIQHLALKKPLGDIAAIARSPFLRRLTSLDLSGHGAAFGDSGAITIANTTHVQGLRVLALWNDAITEVGVSAIAASPNLADAIYIGFDGNPANPTPTASDYEGFYTSDRPGLADDLERLCGPRPWLTAPPATMRSWPPDADDLAVTP